MSRNKSPAKKTKLVAKAKVRPSPRWADIKKFGLKRARSRSTLSGYVGILFASKWVSSRNLGLSLKLILT